MIFNILLYNFNFVKKFLLSIKVYKSNKSILKKINRGICAQNVIHY